MDSDIELKECHFESSSYKILPGTSEYYCEVHKQKLISDFSFYTEVGTIRGNVHIKDIAVEENKSFSYQIVKPVAEAKSKNAVFLFHGFNEKDWDKYYPWAKYIAKKTGRTVVLFPLAFHMQRAPKYWSDRREMYALSELRKKKFPHVKKTSLSNVAISMRLHSMPQRFIWSGLQTYYDVVDLIEECRRGEHPYIDKDFKFDILAYSIGGFLAQVLKLSNYRNYFSDARVCLFCSGATFNRLSPVSKFILDSETNLALYSFYIEHLESILQQDKLLHHYLNEDHLEGKVFLSMLDYQKMRMFREDLLRTYEDQFYAITLKKDIVIPPFEVVNTLNGAYRDINIKVEELDFLRPYTHENPFLSGGKTSAEAEMDIETVFSRVCDFYTR